MILAQCPLCGFLYVSGGLVPEHMDWKDARKRALAGDDSPAWPARCPGSGSAETALEPDKRPLWKKLLEDKGGGQ